MVYVKKEKIIEELQPNQIRAEFIPNVESLNKTGGSYIKLAIVLAEDNKVVTHFPIGKPGSFTFAVDQESAKVLHAKEYVINLKKKGMLWGSTKMDEKKFKLLELSSKVEV